jgi:hypothetical protein
MTYTLLLININLYSYYSRSFFLSFFLSYCFLHPVLYSISLFLNVTVLHYNVFTKAVCSQIRNWLLVITLVKKLHVALKTLFCSLLSVSWLYWEWSSDVGWKYGHVWLSSICAKGDKQQADNVWVWSRLCFGWWTTWRNMYWRKVES